MADKSSYTHVKYYVVLFRSAKYHALMLTKPLPGVHSGSTAQLPEQSSTPTTLLDQFSLPTKSSQFVLGNKKIKQHI